MLQSHNIKPWTLLILISSYNIAINAFLELKHVYAHFENSPCFFSVDDESFRILVTQHMFN